ncbi:uncharacterized protein EI90DRAFT_3030107 [Cantharellus anzutake]|uniref:uncharacterized protein n=1 Tax=Cantharellus anzutake TaxID=1750568 RepID=UPI001907E96C|nr:uncharacterized protein EI90DRAFT_3030107 [Cantharellus anzutake]KAF8342760.1 hypothetical protein EI90DRAFT_3030107 [Cantharellus anzutake]
MRLRMVVGLIDVCVTVVEWNACPWCGVRGLDVSGPKPIPFTISLNKDPYPRYNYQWVSSVSSGRFHLSAFTLGSSWIVAPGHACFQWTCRVMHWTIPTPILPSFQQTACQFRMFNTPHTPLVCSLICLSQPVFHADCFTTSSDSLHHLANAHSTRSYRLLSCPIAISHPPIVDPVLRYQSCNGGHIVLVS